MLIRYEDKVVKYCRFVFTIKKKFQYNDYWIDTKKLEIIEAKNNYFNVEVDLYKKNIDLTTELSKRRVITPPRFDRKRPKPVSKFLTGIELEKDIERFKKECIKYRELKNKNKKEWDNYKKIIYEIIHKDIEWSKKNKITPITILINKVYYKKNNKMYEEHYIKEKK